METTEHRIYLTGIIQRLDRIIQLLEETEEEAEEDQPEKPKIQMRQKE